MWRREEEIVVGDCQVCGGGAAFWSQLAVEPNPVMGSRQAKQLKKAKASACGEGKGLINVCVVGRQFPDGVEGQMLHSISSTCITVNTYLECYCETTCTGFASAKLGQT